MMRIVAHSLHCMRQHDTLAPIPRWMSQRTVAGAFAAWSDHTLQMRGAKQAMQQVAARMVNRQIAAAFFAWQETAHQQHHAGQAAQKMVLRLQQASKVTAGAF